MHSRQFSGGSEKIETEQNTALSVNPLVNYIYENQDKYMLGYHLTRTLQDNKEHKEH